MAWDKAGNTYINDGYVNSRIAKVDKTASGLSRGENQETNRDSSARLTALLSTPKTTSSTWPTAAIAASRS